MDGLYTNGDGGDDDGGGGDHGDGNGDDHDRDHGTCFFLVHRL